MGEASSLIGMSLTFALGFTLGWLTRGRSGDSSVRYDPPPAPAAPVGDVGDAVPSRAHAVDTVQGIGQGYKRRLGELGIDSTLDLLRHCGEPDGLAEICAHLRVKEGVVLRWIRQSDLLRVPGLDAQAAELMEAAGVAGVEDLTEEDPIRLAARLGEINAELRLSPEEVPSPTVVKVWIETGRKLDDL